MNAVLVPGGNHKTEKARSLRHAGNSARLTIHSHAIGQSATCDRVMIRGNAAAGRSCTVVIDADLPYRNKTMNGEVVSGLPGVDGGRPPCKNGEHDKK